MTTNLSLHDSDVNNQNNCKVLAQEMSEDSIGRPLNPGRLLLKEELCIMEE